METVKIEISTHADFWDPNGDAESGYCEKQARGMGEIIIDTILEEFNLEVEVEYTNNRDRLVLVGETERAVEDRIYQLAE